MTYDAVDAAWPKELPLITRDEARRAAHKLDRHFYGRRNGRLRVRRCWIALTPPFSEFHRGWRRLVHDVSHFVWTRGGPKSPEHNRFHADLEREMVEYVVKAGWLTGALKTTVRKRVSTDQKLARVRAAIKRWETKRKRAETALRKLRRRVRYYERQGVTV